MAKEEPDYVFSSIGLILFIIIMIRLAMDYAQK